jgi:hypothetical protein
MASHGKVEVESDIEHNRIVSVTIGKTRLTATGSYIDEAVRKLYAVDERRHNQSKWLEALATLVK